MTRFAAFVLALISASVTLSSACSAAAPGNISFTLQPERSGELIQASFKRERGAREVNNWSSSFSPSQLVGLDVGTFRRGGPLRFAVVREAGRLDCSGSGGRSRAAGHCSFTENPTFVQLLVSRGIGRPTVDESFGLMAADVRRETIEALAAARYPTPTIGQLMALTAVGVTSDYVRSLANAGYRPTTLNSLVEFRALDISPDYVGGFLRAGYLLKSSEFVQLKVLGVTPEFASGFERAGYGRLPAQSLAELKTMGVTPEFARSVRREGTAAPSVRQLVDLRMFGASHPSR